MRLIRLSLDILLCLAFLTIFSECRASGPVASFISEADSIGRTTGAGAEDAFETCVSEHLPILGAAVGQLVEQALETADAGQPEAAEAAFSLAGRLADIDLRHTGSSVPADIVNTSSSWSKHQLALRREARDLEQQAVAARTAGDIDGAIALLGRAMKIYQSIGDKRSIAILWGTLGVTYWAKGDFEDVAVQYEKALAARRAIEDRILEGRTLNGLGSANYQLGNLDLALDYYRQAIELRRATGDTDGLATSLTYLGNTYIAMDRNLDARVALEQALQIVKQNGNTGQHYELLTSIASLNAEMGRMASSNDALAEALELARTMGDAKREMICRNNLALNFAQAYRYGEALDQLGLLRALLEEHPDPEQSMVFYRNRGITYLRIGELEMARPDFNTLLDLSEQHRVPVLELEALLNLGYLSEQTGELEEGLAYAEQALALAQEHDNPKMAREAILLAGQLERSLGRYESSAARWNAALAMDERDSLEIDMARDRVGLASVYVLAGRCEEARDILRGTQAAVERSQDGDLIVASAFAMGHSFERSDPESARFFYERGLNLIDQARAQVGGAEVRTGYLGGLRRFYFEEVATYYAGLAREAGPARGAAAAGWSSLAFHTMERAKARGLLDMLGASVIASGSAAEEALLDSLYRLDPSSPDYDNRSREFKDLYARARQERLASLSAGSSEAAIAGPDEIRRMLPGGTALLEYALGDTMSLVWVIDKEGTQVYFLPKRAILEETVARLRDAIAHPMLADDALRRTAREIYAAIVAPVEDRLKKVRDLVIVPDGGLFELPFEVLLSEEPAPGLAWSDLPYLARKYSITYAPSASIYLALRLRPAPGAESRKPIMDLVAMGDPDYSMLGTAGGRQGPPQPLPHTRTEVSKIAGIMKDKNLDAYVGQEANEAVLKAELKDHPSRIVHLATHGIIDRVEPTASSIVLCPDSSRTEDGYLRTLEVMSSPMDVGLVVLSACESARGEIGRGEGVVGFGRAFLAAGARSVVASLWPVADQSTAILMQAFYERMLTGKQSVGRALNQARLSLMTDQRYAHPYYWSPFVVLGCEYSPW
jgi:CHAT domain-containing protein/Tfp pilus assembly protein PilF